MSQIAAGTGNLSAREDLSRPTSEGDLSPAGAFLQRFFFRLEGIPVHFVACRREQGSVVRRASATVLDRSERPKGCKTFYIWKAWPRTCRLRLIVGSWRPSRFCCCLTANKTLHLAARKPAQLICKRTCDKVLASAARYLCLQKAAWNLHTLLSTHLVDKDVLYLS